MRSGKDKSKMGASAGASIGASLGGKLAPFGAGLCGGLGRAAGNIAGSLVPDCGVTTRLRYRAQTVHSDLAHPATHRLHVCVMVP